MNDAPLALNTYLCEAGILSGLGAEFCDATPHSFATFPFTHRICFWQALRLIRRSCRLQTTLHEIISHCDAIELSARLQLFSFGKEVVANRDVGFDLGGQIECVYPLDRL